MIRVLVTGGAGFVGSHIVERLVRQGANVRILDNLTTGKVENIAAIRGDVELIKGDIRDPDMCKTAMRGVETVFHEAAVVSVAQSISNPRYADAVNVGGTINLLIAARDAGVETFVQASSAAVYGDSQELVQIEGHEGNQLSPYAISKFTAERYGRVFHMLYGMRTVALRYFNVYGPRQNGKSGYATVVPTFILRLLLGEAPVIHGDGEQSRDFVFVGDIAEANIAAACTSGLAGDILNIGSGSSVSINTLAHMIGQYADMHVEPIYADALPGDVRYSQADISRAIDLIGYSPSVSFSAGLGQTVDWYRRSIDRTLA